MGNVKVCRTASGLGVGDTAIRHNHQRDHRCGEDRRAGSWSGRRASRRREGAANRARRYRRALARRAVQRRLWAGGDPRRAGRGGGLGAQVQPADHRRDRGPAGGPCHLLPAGHRGVPERRRRLRRLQNAPRHHPVARGRGLADGRLHTERRRRRVGRRGGAHRRLPCAVRRPGLDLPGGAGADHRGEPVGGGRVGPAVHAADGCVHRVDLRRHRDRPRPQPPCRPARP